MGTARRTAAVRFAKTRPAIDGMLKGVVLGKKLLKFQSGAKLFSQGEKGDAIYFIRTGKVHLTVVSAQGREAILAVLGPSDFLGEEIPRRQFPSDKHGDEREDIHNIPN